MIFFFFEFLKSFGNITFLFFFCFFKSGWFFFFFWIISNIQDQLYVGYSKGLKDFLIWTINSHFISQCHFFDNDLWPPVQVVNCLSYVHSNHLYIGCAPTSNWAKIFSFQRQDKIHILVQRQDKIHMIYTYRILVKSNQVWNG